MLVQCGVGFRSSTQPTLMLKFAPMGAGPTTTVSAGHGPTLRKNNLERIYKTIYEARNSFWRSRVSTQAASSSGSVVTG